MRYLKSISSVFAAVVFMTGCSKKVVEKQEVVRPAKIIAVKRGAKIASRTYPGKAYAHDTVELSFRIAGPLLKIPVSAGLMVKKGDVLARIDPRDFEVNLEKAKAAVIQSEAKVKAAEKEFKRQEMMLKQNATSQALYDDARGLYESEKANLLAMKAQEKEAQDALNDTKLVAPFTGVVAKIYVDSFQDVQAKQPILLLQNVSKIDVKVDVPEQLMVFKRNSGSSRKSKIFVEFTSIPGKKYEMKLKEMTTIADPDTNAFEVTLTMDAPKDFALKSGMTCVVTHQSTFYGSHEWIVIPTEAVLSKKGGQSSVWVLGDDNRLVSREVKVGEIHEDGVEIISGLKVGEKILAAGVHYAYEGMPVKPLVKE